MSSTNRAKRTRPHPGRLPIAIFGASLRNAEANSKARKVYEDYKRWCEKMQLSAAGFLTRRITSGLIKNA